MKRRNRIIEQYIGLCLGILLCLPIQSKAKNHIAFNDAASTMILKSVQPLAKNNFLLRLYGQLLFVPVWMQEERLSPLSQALFSEIIQDETLLKTSRLKRDAIRLKEESESCYRRFSTLKEKISLEFKISQLYKGYADYILYGSINWGAFQARLYNLRKKSIKAEWITYKPKFSPISLLESAAMRGDLSEMFQKASPKEYHYAMLKQALYSLIEIKKSGGWGKVSFKGILRPGKVSSFVPILRERLRKSRDYSECEKEETTQYDTCLTDAVIHFQKRHGLVAKGIVGKETLKGLNVSVEQRIKEVRLNLDRIKWLHQRDSKRHLIINIPAFTLFFEKDEKLIQKMRVITGRKTHPTPIFSNTVKSIVLNPSWNVPKSIIQKEMIPKLMRNPNAMAKKGIEIRRGWGENAEKIDASSIDWSQYRYSKHMPFHFAQVPGYKNALGKVKFLFPNQFSVYMHDTPNKNLFKRNVRAFSHGCIRLQKPRELLKTFSTFNESVDFEKAQERLKGKKKAYLTLTEQVPVDVVYLTAYVDYDGILQFRNDIYGYDKIQLQSYRNW